MPAPPPFLPRCRPPRISGMCCTTSARPSPSLVSRHQIRWHFLLHSVTSVRPPCLPRQEPRGPRHLLLSHLEMMIDRGSPEFAFLQARSTSKKISPKGQGKGISPKAIVERRPQNQERTNKSFLKLHAREGFS